METKLPQHCFHELAPIRVPRLRDMIVHPGASRCADPHTAAHPISTPRLRESTEHRPEERVAPGRLRERARIAQQRRDAGLPACRVVAIDQVAERVERDMLDEGHPERELARADRDYAAKLVMRKPEERAVQCVDREACRAPTRTARHPLAENGNVRVVTAKSRWSTGSCSAHTVAAVAPAAAARSRPLHRSSVPGLTRLFGRWSFRASVGQKRLSGTADRSLEARRRRSLAEARH